MKRKFSFGTFFVYPVEDYIIPVSFFIAEHLSLGTDKNGPKRTNNACVYSISPVKNILATATPVAEISLLFDLLLTFEI